MQFAVHIALQTPTMCAHDKVNKVSHDRRRDSGPGKPAASVGYSDKYPRSPFDVRGMRVQVQK